MYYGRGEKERKTSAAGRAGGLRRRLRRCGEK